MLHSRSGMVAFVIEECVENAPIQILIAIVSWSIRKYKSIYLCMMSYIVWEILKFGISLKNVGIVVTTHYKRMIRIIFYKDFVQWVD